MYIGALQHGYCMPQFRSFVHGSTIKLKRSAAAFMHHTIDTIQI